MEWTVLFTGKAKRQKDKLPQRYQDALDIILKDKCNSAYHNFAENRKNQNCQKG